jgi:hypothetical protein
MASGAGATGQDLNISGPIALCFQNYSFMSDYLSLRNLEIIEPAILNNCTEIKQNNSHYFVRQ